MKTQTRLLALILAVLLAIAMLVSCDNGNGDGKDTSTTIESTPTPETTVLQARDLDIILNGASNCSVIRSDLLDTEAEAVACASDIRTAILNATGVSPKITTDWTKDGTHDSNAIEILVGQTTYAESTEVLAPLSYGEYVVKVIGNKLVVAAYSEDAIRLATNKLITLINEKAEKDSLTIPADTFYSESVNEKLAALPGYDGGNFSSTYECGGDAIEVIIKNTKLEEYQSYLTKLQSAGYSQYVTTTIADNQFATYTNEEYTVNAGFYKYENSARIIIEPLAKPVGLESDNVYTAVTTSQITMFGLEYVNSSNSTVSNGLSVLIRLTDGRFIVIDGGFSDSAAAPNCAANITKAMTEQSKDYLKSGEKITIAAWIITHAHGDHSGMIQKQYGAFMKYNVENFLVNFISESERNKAISTYLAKGSTNWSNGEGGGFSSVITAAKALNANIQYVRVGQIFYFADLKLEVLYTIDSFGPNLCNAFNTTSTVMKMTFGDGTVYMSTGDATGNALSICAKMYGSYLKSDIVQVSHHGYSTWGNDSGTASAYKLMTPTTLLWPQGLTAFPNYKGKSYNAVLFSANEVSGGVNSNFKECYIAGAQGDSIIVPIPFTVGNVIVNRK